MGKCAEMGINLVFCTPRGKFLARTCGISNGNVLLRRKQYRIADEPEQSIPIAKNCIVGKIYNERQVVERMRRDHPQRIDEDRFSDVSEKLHRHMEMAAESDSFDRLRGVEGSAASIYFGLFNDMILQNKDDFTFQGRNRRPPLDRVNALLSFVYTLLGNDCASALECTGLDSYVGIMHQDRPGRKSLAQDLVEELRPCMADRFVLSAINNRIITGEHFLKQDSGAVLLSDAGRKIVQREWQEKKQIQLTHRFLKIKVAWGLVAYAQALLLARHLRGDLDGYPPFLWR